MTLHELVEDLEGKARTSEQAAQRYREAATAVREAYGLTARTELTAPVPTAKPAPRAAATTPSGSREEKTDAAILAFLKSKTEPVNYFEIRAAVNVKVPLVRKSIDRMVQAGLATRSGNTRNVKVLAKAPARPKPADREPVAAPRQSAPSLTEQIAEALMVGPFADPEKRLTVAECMPFVKVPGAGVDHVLSALGMLLRTNRVTLLSVGTERVYRKVA